MGRGAGEESCTAPVTRAPQPRRKRAARVKRKSAGNKLPKRSKSDSLLVGAKTYIDRLEALASRAERKAGPQSIEQRLEARAGGLRGLTYDPAAQQRLIKAIKVLEGGDSDAAREVARRGREIFILCHAGLAHKLVRRYSGSLENVSDRETHEVLMQSARVGLNRAIDGYEEDAGANPATYAKNWIRAMIGEQIEAEGRAIRIKSKAHDRLMKVRKAVRELDSVGEGLNGVTLEQISARSGVELEHVAELLPHVNRIAEGGGFDDFGWVPGPEEDAPDHIVVDEQTQRMLREEIAGMAPLEGRLISALYGLDGEEVEQRDLFLGVYRNGRGQRFTAEPSVVKEAEARKVKVTKVSQRDLNARFKEGTLHFEAWSVATAKLTSIDADPLDQKIAGVFSRETGVPPTSGTVQEAKRIAEERLALNPRLQSLCPRYRGPNELENSAAARVDVARALVRLGKLERAEAEKMARRTRTAKGSKSALRLEAENARLVDEKLGSVDRDKLRAALGPAAFHDRSSSSFSDMAEMMAEAPVTA